MTAKPIILVTFLAIAAAVCVEWTVPGSRRTMAIFAAICGVGAWTAPGLAFALSRRPRTALGAVGATISLLSLAALFSAIGLPLAVAALVLGEGANWARFALLAISAFWFFFAASIAVAGRRSRRVSPRPP